MEISSDKFDVRSQVPPERMILPSKKIRGSLGGGRGGTIPHISKAGIQLLETTEGGTDPRMDATGFGISFSKFCGLQMLCVGGGVREGRDLRDDIRLL